jgi:hypothetical protein
MHIEELLTRLDSVKKTRVRYMARCPAHADKSPSLSVTEGDKAILLKCWAGCDLREIIGKLGLSITDLFFNTPTPRGQRPTPKPPKVDRIAMAFRFELAALNRRLRAERIIAAGKTLDVSSLSNAELDRALGSVAQAVADLERAELFECVADDLRMKEFLGRDYGPRQCVA